MKAKRTEVLTLRCSKGEKAAVKRQAKKEDRSTGEVVRRALEIYIEANQA